MNHRVAWPAVPDDRPPAPAVGVWKFTYDGAITAFVRHRRGEQRADAARYRASKEALGWALKRAWGPRQPIAPEIPILVVATFWQRATYRQDADNLIKGLLDAMTGIVYHDDRYVTDEQARKAVGRPGVEMTVWWGAPVIERRRIDD